MIEALSIEEVEEKLKPLIDDYDWELMKDSDPNLSEQ